MSFQYALTNTKAWRSRCWPIRLSPYPKWVSLLTAPRWRRWAPRPSASAASWWTRYVHLSQDTYIHTNHTITYIHTYMHQMITVKTDEICSAIKLGFNDTRCVLEPAGALGIAGNYKRTHIRTYIHIHSNITVCPFVVQESYLRITYTYIHVSICSRLILT